MRADDTRATSRSVTRPAEVRLDAAARVPARYSVPVEDALLIAVNLYGLFADAANDLGYYHVANERGAPEDPPALFARNWADLLALRQPATTDSVTRIGVASAAEVLGRRGPRPQDGDYAFTRGFTADRSLQPRGTD